MLVSKRTLARSSRVKRADLITIRLDRPHAVPFYNIYSQVVYALKGSDVQDVVVNGKPIVRPVHEFDAKTNQARAVLD